MNAEKCSFSRMMFDIGRLERIEELVNLVREEFSKTFRQEARES